ncbi:MAG: response regulator, partial [Devosia sp.]
IAPDEIDHIFEPFVRGQAERNKMSPGLGLGLTITKLLSETLGGDIAVESEPGKGSLFRVRLMLARVHRPALRAAQDRRITGYAGPRRTIVVVDDNADHRELMRELLQPLDFTMLTANDGAECLTLVDGISPDLYFVDISMPGMNGWELVTRLRAKGHTMPIIMLSANIGDGSGAAISDAGHNDTITKPFDVRQVFDKLEAHLKLEWLDAEARDAEEDEPSLPIVLPEPAHLSELKSLGEIGYVRGIEAKLAEIATVPAHAPFVDLLRARVQAFDFEGYAKILESAAEDD